MKRLLSVNIAAVVHEGEWTGSVGRTGIDKRPVEHRILVANDHVEGDAVLDVKAHGGRDKAVYAYAREDGNWWENELGIQIGNGRFGENLTTEGVDVTGALIGERWRIGSALLEVAEPRIPCTVFAGFWQRPGLVKEFTEAGRPGAYLRIIEEGIVGSGDEIVIESRPERAATISDAFAAKSGDRSQLVLLAETSAFSPAWHEWIARIAK